METNALESGVGNSGGIGDALIDSIMTPSVSTRIASLLDVAINRLTTVDIFSEIPVLDIFCKAYGVIESIRNDIFLKKLVYFLHGCADRDLKEKTKFEKELEIDGALRAKVGEDLILILDRVDHFEKASILGKVFAGRLREEIDEDTFFKLATAIGNASITDLRTLETSYNKIASYDPKAGKMFAESLDDDTSQSLYNVGFVRSDGVTEITYHANDLGSCLIRLMK